MSERMYDQFSQDYDRFVNWTARLAVEMPFILRQLEALDVGKRKPIHVLDAACGTGMHAIALAQQGYLASGADLSAGMIEQARQNAAKTGVEARFEVAGFGRLAETFGQASFDALICLGNSLPHILSRSALQSTLDDFSACLRQGGLLLIQNRNFDAVLAKRERWMEPQAHREGDNEWLFVRFYDFNPDGLIDFHVLTLSRHGLEPWKQHITSTRLWPLGQAELAAALAEAGFTRISWYGDMQEAPYMPETSANLVVAAFRSEERFG